MNLKFYMPTQIIQGRDCIKEHRILLGGMGAKALIVTGKTSAKASGSLDDITEVLELSGIAWCLFDAVEANPTIETCRQAAAFARENGADFVIGCGGGSPMDAAKAIAILISNNVDDTALFSGEYSNPVLPIIAVPTTAGTGSEVTPYSILTDHKAETKRSIATEHIFPRVAFLDAKYLKALPLNITINTAIDALSHSLEGFLSHRVNPMSANIATDSIKIISEVLRHIKDAVTDEDREKLLYGSMLAGVVIAHTGTTALHSMGYSLTYFRNIDHGRANGLLMHKYLQFLAQEHSLKIAEVLELMRLDSLGELEKMLDSLLEEKENITEDEIKRFSAIAIQAKNIANTLRIPSQADLEAIYRSSFGV